MPYTRLKELIRDRCVKRGTFTLTSGETSDIYLDLRKVTASSQSAGLIGAAVLAQAERLGAAGVGGMEAGAIPLATAAAFLAGSTGRNNLEGFWVRKEQRKHGTRNRIEGAVQQGDRVLVVEDVCTTGESMAQAVVACREAALNVVGTFCLVDRSKGRGARKMEEFGLELARLWTLDEIAGSNDPDGDLCTSKHEIGLAGGSVWDDL